jgi:fermentation-respiration switch protein FrsA (DUF1100 family)
MAERMTMKGWRYWFNLWVFGLVVLSVVVIVSVATASYRSISVYLHPQRQRLSDNETPDVYGVAYENIRLVTSDGVELAAWYTPSENGALILVAHGHGDIRSVNQYVMYAQNEYGVLAWDFRAHGESGGKMSTLGYYETLDVEAALEFVLQQEGVDHIGAWGGSMGGVAVLEASSRRVEIEAVVVDSAFSTLEDEVRLAVTKSAFLPFIRFFAKMETGIDFDQLRPVDRIGELSPRPIMIIQGEADSMIPADSAQRLFEAAGEPKYLWTEAGVNHVGMHSMLPEKYEEQVIGFFNEYLLQMDE